MPTNFWTTVSSIPPIPSCQAPVHHLRKSGASCDGTNWERPKPGPRRTPSTKQTGRSDESLHDRQFKTTDKTVKEDETTCFERQMRKATDSAVALRTVAWQQMSLKPSSATGVDVLPLRAKFKISKLRTSFFALFSQLVGLLTSTNRRQNPCFGQYLPL